MGFVARDTHSGMELTIYSALAGIRMMGES